LESNRISLADHTGTKMVSIYPKVNGSVSDADIERHPKGCLSFSLNTNYTN
jgi:hypothetical protein